tara:strand:+ start:3928 stop:4545 length:618 start_codon:yes stop_codon:yes gene_type:complete
MPIRKRGKRRYAAVVAAASTGGIAALRQLLGSLDERFPLPVLIVQHTTPDEDDTLQHVFSVDCRLPVVMASARQPIEGGRVYLAPPAYHLLVEEGPRVALSVDARVCYVRPSADVLFASASDVWGRQLIGIVLTGANEDGANGMALLRDRGGLAIVQNPEEAEIDTMPQATLDKGGADHVLEIAQIGALLNTLCVELIGAPVEPD